MRLATSHGKIQFQGHPKSALKCFQCMASGQHWETSLSQRVRVGSQEMVGEETHISRDAVKLNNKEAPLWSVGMPLVGRCEGHEVFAYAHQALPQTGVAIKEMPVSLPLS